MGKGGSAGPYAERGTLADEAFRLSNMGKRLYSTACGLRYVEVICDCCTHEEIASFDPLEVLDARIEALALKHGIKNKPARKGVEWAIAKMRSIAGEGVECITDEARLTVKIEGLDADSVADGNAPASGQGFDLKTGAIADYLSQMAGYALGFMVESFSDKWTMHLLFMDHETVITHVFTYEEARNIVLGIRSQVLDPDRKPVLNQYCSWCALSETCTARTEAAQRALEYAGGLNAREGIGKILGSNALLSDFLSACDVLKGFEQVAREKARSKLETGERLSAWQLTTVLGIGHVTPEGAIMHTKKLPKGEELTLEKIFKALGNLTPFQFKRIMESVNKPLPKKWRSQGRPSTYLMRAKKKAKL